MFFRNNRPADLKIDLHIGTHKTGTTSIQAFLFDNRESLLAEGVDLYRGNPWKKRRRNHVDLATACLRAERSTFLKLRRATPDPLVLHRRVSRWVQRQARHTGATRLVLTNEDLSLLRFPDEMDRLRTIFGPYLPSVRVILYLRDLEDFKASWRGQVLKYPGREFSDDPDSVLYVGDDSWVFNFAALVKVYEDAFGSDRLLVRNYSEIVREEGDVIPSFLRLLDLDPSAFGALNRYRLRVRES